MKIKIDLKIFIFAIIFLLTKQIRIYGILMLFALIHECGHLLVGIILKFKPLKLEIMPYGLSIDFKVECNDYNKKIKKGTMLSLKKMLIAFAGPFTNLIIVLVFIMFNINLFGIERELVIYSNILIGLFNLIPIYPLDGGRILKELLHFFIGLEKSDKYTNITSKITIFLITFLCSIIILYIRNIAMIIILTYLWYIVLKEDRRYYNREKIRSVYNHIKSNNEVSNLNY